MTELSPKRRHIAEEAYKDFRSKIERLTTKLSHKFGVHEDDVEDWLIEGFLRQVESYDKEMDNFEQWVTLGMIDKVREQMKKVRRRAAHFAPAELDLIGVQRQHFSLVDFIDALSDDSAIVVDTVFKSPKAVERAVARLGKPTGRNVRSALKDYLRKTKKWDGRRIEDAFTEIREKL